MGCDIHLYREKKVNGQWLAADNWREENDYEGGTCLEVNWKERAYTGRNYEFFGLLCKGVRSVHPFSLQARGIPFNACKEIAECSERWGEDGHNHSYLYLHELKDLSVYLDQVSILVEGMKDQEGIDKLQESIDSCRPDWNLLFPYCQYTNQPGHAGFSVKVPASFYMGECLRQIIDSFDGMDGDNHRIVFFFDN